MDYCSNAAFAGRTGSFGCRATNRVGWMGKRYIIIEQVVPTGGDAGGMGCAALLGIAVLWVVLGQACLFIGVAMPGFGIDAERWVPGLPVWIKLPPGEPHGLWIGRQDRACYGHGDRSECRMELPSPEAAEPRREPARPQRPPPSEWDSQAALGANCNLRRGPSQSSTSLGVYDRGTRCDVSSRSTNAGWNRVRCFGAVGYMHDVCF